MTSKQTTSPATPAPVPQQSKTALAFKNMLCSGIGGTIALSSVYPVESIKTYIQIKSESNQKLGLISAGKQMIKAEGFSSLYRGIPAACCRQFFFASLRVGLFFNLSDWFKKNKKRPMTFFESCLGSLATGAIGISAVMPFDVIFVRFQADAAAPVNQRRGYTSLGNAISRIIKEEGAGTLWRGIIPAITRAAALNLGMMAPYDKTKNLLAPYLGYTRTNYLLASAVSGFCGSFCSLPFDNAKVKMQKMKPGADGKMPYSGLFDCIAKTAKREGVTGLWAGFIPFYALIGPHSMLTLLISDALRIVFGISSR